MKKLFPSLLVFGLVGCGGGMGDLHQYVAQVQATPVPFREPEVVRYEFAPIPYEVEALRSPFTRWQRKPDDPIDVGRKDCPQPDLNRTRGFLETYAVDSMTLKGTLQEGAGFWGLLEAGDGQVYPVRRGDYLGLYHGQVININVDGLVVTEWIPDGEGCWDQRDTKLVLARD